MNTKIEKYRTQEINNLHSEIVGYLKMSLQKAIRIGELLTEQKAQMKHGEWLPWVAANLSFTDRTARNYMRCYAERDTLKTEMISDLSGALKLLTHSDSNESKESKNLPELIATVNETHQIAREAAEQKIRAEKELGKALNNLEHTADEDERLMNESERLLAELEDIRALPSDSPDTHQKNIAWHEDAELISQQWNELFRLAGRYYPEFAVFNEPNRYVGMPIEELMRELDKILQLGPESPYELTPVGFKMKRESTKEEWLVMAHQLKKAGEILDITKRKIGKRQGLSKC